MGGGKNGSWKETNSLLCSNWRFISVRISIIVNKTIHFSNCFLLFNTRPFRRTRKGLTSSRLLASGGGTMFVGERKGWGLSHNRSHLFLGILGKMHTLATFPWFLESSIGWDQRISPAHLWPCPSVGVEVWISSEALLSWYSPDNCQQWILPLEDFQEEPT